MTALNIAVNGFGNGQLNTYFESGYQVGTGGGNGQSKPLGQAIRDAIAGGYEPIVFINENFNDSWTVEKYDAGITAQNTFDQLQLLVSKIKAIDSTIKIVTNTPGPVADYWNSHNTAGAQYARRSDFAIWQEQLAQLIVADSKTGTKLYTVADVAHDTVYNAAVEVTAPEQPQTTEGIHYTQYAIEKKQIGARWMAAYMESLFGLAQPAPATH